MPQAVSTSIDEFKANGVKLFWVFVICSVLGLAIEDVVHIILYGEFQLREGMLFGPFSPIYGAGGVVVAIVGKRARNLPLPAVFLTFAITGGAIEFVASWFMQHFFGILAWDYAGTFLSIGGRTNGLFMSMWGLLGMACVRLVLPAIDRHLMPLAGRIPKPVTALAIVFIITDVVMTLQSFNCWYQRLDGLEPETPLQQYFAEHYDNEYMANHFQSMSLFPQDAARTTSSR